MCFSEILANRSSVGTNEPPATLAEFTLAADTDHYDISLVDGTFFPQSLIGGWY